MYIIKCSNVETNLQECKNIILQFQTKSNNLFVVIFELIENKNSISTFV